MQIRVRCSHSAAGDHCREDASERCSRCGRPFCSAHMHTLQHCPACHAEHLALLSIRKPLRWWEELAIACLGLLPTVLLIATGHHPRLEDKPTLELLVFGLQPSLLLFGLLVITKQARGIMYRRRSRLADQPLRYGGELLGESVRS